MARATRSVLARDGALRPFRLLRQDWRNLAARYASDWTIFNQLIVASAVYVFFTNLLPGITFASDLYELTGQNWGTIEVVFSTGLCGIIFSLFSIQPLTILGVTGPFSILAENIYSLCISAFHAIQELERAHDRLSFAAFLYAIIGCIGTCLLAIFLASAEKWKPLFHRYIRMGLSEYAAAISIIFFIGIPHVGELASLDKDTLNVSKSFTPSSPERTTFFVRFWELPIAWIFAALIPGAIITVLFFFDHEVSSIICTINRYGTRKPGGFAWDIALLGTTTAICGILGIPPANGLLPQAPLHSESLMHADRETVQRTTSTGEETAEIQVSHRVYEQRWSHFLHAAGILAFVSPPLMHVLGLTPTSVLAGLFLFMGEQSLSVNPILYRTFHMLTPASELPKLPQTIRNYIPIHLYTLTQIILTVIIFIITLTKAGPAFPIIIILLVPVRLFFMNKVWNRETLRYVDAWACRDDVESGENSEAGNGTVMLQRLSSAVRKD
ncbi:Bicarbonate transporter protein [Neofusicoccum parvum]|uniref:Bicarbonate transporter protein n=1 Tax=Neofusicoccum parvum TaxID=310453 RepID=A0ACB5S1Z3_9PEZI|nr:Bicarbonate transporter protein [Neofusicoccum parvum]